MSYFIHRYCGDGGSLKMVMLPGDAREYLLNGVLKATVVSLVMLAITPLFVIQSLWALVLRDVTASNEVIERLRAWIPSKFKLISVPLTVVPMIIVTVLHMVTMQRAIIWVSLRLARGLRSASVDRKIEQMRQVTPTIYGSVLDTFMTAQEIKAARLEGSNRIQVIRDLSRALKSKGHEPELCLMDREIHGAYEEAVASPVSA